MINQLEIPMYLAEALPEISPDLTSAQKSNPYVAMNSLLTFTCDNIRAHNFNTVKTCFQVADKFYSKGNAMVKNAVQNVFVFSFTKMFHNHPAEKKELMAIIPITLYSLYISQVFHGGC